MKNVQKVYIHLRPRTHQATRVIAQIEDLMVIHPGANVCIAGLGNDEAHSTISIEIIVPRSNTNPVSVSGLYFAQAVFTSLFDYAPCYAAAPTEVERLNAERFMANRSRERTMLMDSERGILASS